MAEIRLQMEEMRRQLSLRQQVEMAKQEQRRYEATKDAFFKVVRAAIAQSDSEHFLVLLRDHQCQYRGRLYFPTNKLLSATIDVSSSPSSGISQNSAQLAVD
ncbi:hypothetical protein niasHS_002229 [Heterodera schachtii]